jgi:hypothetical protein
MADRMSNLDGEPSFSAYQPMNSQLSQAFTSPSKQEMFGGIEPTMQGADWHVQSSDSLPTYSDSFNGGLHTSTNNQLGYPNHSPPNFTTQSCDISASTSTPTPTPTTGAVGGYQTSTTWGTTPTVNTTMLIPTNNTNWAEETYPAGSTEENDTAAQELDWFEYVKNSCNDVMQN